MEILSPTPTAHKSASTAVNAPPDPVMRKYFGIFMKQGFVLYSPTDDPDFPCSGLGIPGHDGHNQNKQEPGIDRDKLDENSRARATR